MQKIRPPPYAHVSGKPHQHPNQPDPSQNRKGGRASGHASSPLDVCNAAQPTTGGCSCMQPVNSHHSKRVSAGTIAAGNALELAAGATTASARTGRVGTVTDSKGGVVPNAKVTITNTDQQVVVRTLTTDDRGEYAAPLLPVGRYSVTAEIAGFKKVTQSGVVLNVNDKLAVNFTMEIGTVSESVTVEANSLRVELQSVTATGLINGTQLRELSLNSRN